MIRTLLERDQAANLDQLIQQLRELDLPLVDEIADDIQSTVLGGAAFNTSGDTGGGISSVYNRIPSDHHGPCTNVLLVYCLGNGFERRLQEALRHSTEVCPGTEQVYIVTNQWGPTVWQKHERRFHALSANVTVILYAIGQFSLLT